MTKKEFINDIQNIVNEIARKQTEHKEIALAEFVTKYDFIVGSIEYMHELMEILPEGANVIYSPFFDIGDPTMIYVIKKFDIMDLLTEPYRGEGEGL